MNALLTVEEFFRNYGKYAVIGLLGIFFIIIFIEIFKRREDKITDDVFQEIFGEEGETKNVGKFQPKGSKGYLAIEETILSILHIDPNKNVIFAIRVAIVIAFLVLAGTFKYIAIYFVFEVFMFLYTTAKEKQVEDDNGLSYIDRTNKFLDLYIPSVSNGQAVNQVMNRFVESENDEELTRWWYLDDEDKEENIPKSWDNVIRIYQNGIYNEQNGFQDSAEVFQQDLIGQIEFYNNFKEKIGEIGPIKGCYYLFMPVILLISYTNSPEFWGTFLGLVDVLFLCGMLFMFSFLLSKLHKDTCEKLF